MGTFSKSLASCGGFIAGPADVIEYLRIQSRPFLFTAAAGAGGRRRRARRGAHLPLAPRARELFARVLEAAEHLHGGLRELGFRVVEPHPLPGGERLITPIVPVVVGDDWKAALLWRALWDAGVYVNVALHPAVPPAGALLRTSVMATHDAAVLDRALEAFARVKREFEAEHGPLPATRLSGPLEPVQIRTSSSVEKKVAPSGRAEHLSIDRSRRGSRTLPHATPTASGQEDLQREGRLAGGAAEPAAGARPLGVASRTSTITQIDSARREQQAGSREVRCQGSPIAPGHEAMPQAVPQRIAALERANRVRLARAELKRRVAAGTLAAAEVIRATPWEATRMPVGELLTSQRRWGVERSRRCLGVAADPREQAHRDADRPPARGAGRGARGGRLAGSTAGPGASCEGRAGRRRAVVLEARARGSRSRRCGRRGRAGRSSGRSRGRARRCSPRRGSAGSRATPRAPRPTPPRSARWWVEPVPTVPGGIVGYSRKETSVPGAPPASPNQKWRESGSSSLVAALTSASPSRSR